MRRLRPPLAATFALGILLPAAAAAQTAACHPSHDSNEAKLLAFYSVPMAFSPGGAVAPMPPGAVRIGLELTYVPTPSLGIQQSDECYGLEKRENTELSPVFPRPRLLIGLPGGFSVDLSYLPPVSVNDAEPNLGSVAVAWTHRLGEIGTSRALDLVLRAHGTVGRISGAITCPADDLQQTAPAQACYGDEPSDDTYKPNMFGGEVLLGMHGGGRFGGYGGVGVTRLMPRFQVDFQQLDGFHDDTRIIVDMTRAALMLGGQLRLTPRFDLTFEAYSVLQDATTARLGAGFRL